MYCGKYTVCLVLTTMDLFSNCLFFKLKKCHMTAHDTCVSMAVTHRHCGAPVVWVDPELGSS